MGPDEIKDSLTRKLGPLPIWVWAVIAGVALYVVRNRMKSGSVVPGGAPPTAAATAAEAQLVTAEGNANALSIRTPVTLQPGERVFDPTTGFLSTQPNDTLNNSLVNILGSLLLPQPPATPPGSSVKVAAKKGNQPKLGKGAIRAPSGHNKPTAPAGYIAKGLGHGNWEFVKAPKTPRTRTNKGTETEDKGSDKGGDK